MGLQLLFKRANNQICTLPIEFPSKNALSGFAIFSYSILSSLNYASCSYMTNSSFIMEPDLSFMDTSYSDVIYFADPDSRSSFWNIRQFKFDKDGYFKAMETFIVKNFAEEKDKNMLCARDHLLALDGQRHKLHAIQRHNKVVTSTCAYDLLFRPSKATIKKLDPLRHDSVQFRVNSLAADGIHLLIGESRRQSHDQFSTKVFFSERDKNDSSECLLQLPFLAEFGFISMETKESLEKTHLPRFEEQNDVGDGRLLDSEEVEQRKKQENEDDNELGLMTEITTKDFPPEKEDQLTEGSGELLSSEVIGTENLNSTACWECRSYPVLLAFTAMIVSTLVIYRRKPKPKLICKEENEWLMIAQAVDIGSQAEALLANGTYFEVTNSDSQDSSSESREQVRIVPRRLKRSIQESKKPVMELGEPILVISDHATELDKFEIVGGELTKEEKQILRQKLLATCSALEID
ncbi:hypothetical protein FO519_001698 [Halicephalobus sp. NKZ332]|nr:hypothetical protein FO519_001698 [Halicephalobus sp. NKZ332]